MHTPFIFFWYILHGAWILIWQTLVYHMYKLTNSQLLLTEVRLLAEKSSHSFLGKSLSANFVSCHSILKGMLAYSFANHICSTKYATNAQLVMALIFLRNIKWASKTTIGNSLVVQRLELFTFTAKGVDSILDWGTKILKVTLCSQNKQTKKMTVITWVSYIQQAFVTCLCRV